MFRRDLAQDRRRRSARPREIAVLRRQGTPPETGRGLEPRSRAAKAAGSVASRSSWRWEHGAPPPSLLRHLGHVAVGHASEKFRHVGLRLIGLKRDEMPT